MPRCSSIPIVASAGGAGDWRGRVAVADLLTIAGRIVGERSTQRALRRLRPAPRHGRCSPATSADRALIQYTERLLAGAVGAASARRILMGALSGSGLDIAEAMALMDEASQELRFNRELLSTTLENVSQGISVVDARMRLVAWNRRYLELFDYPDGMVYVGVPVADLIRWNAEHGECGPGEVDAHVAKRIGHMRAGTPHLFQRVRPDGTVIEMRGRALPGGGYVTTYTDVTAYKHAEQALIEANETLEQRVEQRTAELSRGAGGHRADARRAAETANVSKTRFLAAASHDLLQPLNAARLFTSALRQQPGLDAEAEPAGRAHRCLVPRRRGPARCPAGRLAPGCRQLPAGVRRLRAGRPVRFAARRSSRWSPNSAACGCAWCRPRCAVRSDPQLLRRVLQNFLSNALRYTSEGGVLLGARRAGGEVRIEVWDTGPGIAAGAARAHLRRIPAPGAPSPWGEKGLGLGLSICDRLAAILGHRLDLHSRVGHGSCFCRRGAAQRQRCRVRRQRVQRQRAGQADAADRAVPGQRRGHPRWHAGAAEALGRGLPPRRGRGAGRAAAARAAAIDLLLADYHLADGIDGLQALQQLRTLRGELPPVAMITADGSSELKQRARELGYPLLHKPVRPAALRALLGALLRKQASNA